MKKILVLLLVVVCGHAVAQQRKTKNLIVITLDGYRWKELFTGADEELINTKVAITQKNSKEKYWRTDLTDRRAVLMPFFWNTIAKKGQLYGNRTQGNFFNVKNPYWFSYPGYNEMFTGYADTIINSNAYPPNPNVNVFEFINKQHGFEGKVAVFAGWNAFYNILNAERSKLPINAGWTELKGPELNEVEQTLNEQQRFTAQIFGPDERHDAITYAFAKNYIKHSHPRVLGLGFTETDAFAHQGKYDFYLDAAHHIDSMIADLWNYLQNDPFYKDQTTLLITADHGRGDGEKLWRSHKNTIPHSNEIWMCVMGPDTMPLGEIKQAGQLYQNQLAKTIAGLLGLNFTSKNPIGEMIVDVNKK